MPNTFVLSPAQRSHLEPAVTAWAQWSADRRDLGEAGTTVLMDRVPQVLSRFSVAYDDPDAVAIRGYASGLAASDADIAWLSDQVGRRMFALPLPGRARPAGPRGPRRPAPPGGRRVPRVHPAVRDDQRGVHRGRGRASSRTCGATAESPVYQAASRMFADGVARHDIIHRLAGTPAPTVGSSLLR